MTLASILLAALVFNVFMTPNGSIDTTSAIGGFLCVLGSLAFIAYVFCAFICIIFDNNLKFVASEVDFLGMLRDNMWILMVTRQALVFGFMCTMVQFSTAAWLIYPGLPGMLAALIIAFVTAFGLTINRRLRGFKEKLLADQFNVDLIKAIEKQKQDGDPPSATAQAPTPKSQPPAGWPPTKPGSGKLGLI